jgi:hypothetical protein
VFPVAFLLAGIFTLASGLKGIHRGVESLQWPTADGMIENSTVEYRSDSDSGGTHHAKLLYQFVVNGKMYRGTKVAVGDYGTSSPAPCGGIVNRYPLGKAVIVHYRQDDPAICLLEPGLQGQAWVMPGVGLILVVVGLCLPKVMKKTEADFTEPSKGASR